MVRQPRGPIALGQRPHAPPLVRPARAFGFARLVDPFVRRQPVVRRQRRVPRPRVPVAQGTHLLFALVGVVLVLLPAALADPEDVQLSHLSAVPLLTIQGAERQLWIGLPLLAPDSTLPSGGLGLEVRQGGRATALRE